MPTPAPERLALRSGDPGLPGLDLRRPDAGADLRVLHMTSFSRCGETLMLRTLNAHPALAVVHQLREPDVEPDLALFRRLRDGDEPVLRRDDPDLAHRDDLGGVRALILKNAVWEHRHPHDGFILARNPLAMIASARTLVETPASKKVHREQARRWCRRIDRTLMPFVGATDSTTAFCALWARKMGAAHRMGLPIVRYEDFVARPEPVLRRLLERLGLDWSDAVLHSHAAYAEGEIGHGGIKLWRPISTGSLEKYLASLPERARAKVAALCHTTMALYGYRFDGERVRVEDDFDDRLPR